MKSKVDRLCELFATKTELCDWRALKSELRHNGGRMALAAAIGVDHSVISRWNGTGKRGCGGSIPPQYNARIIEAVDARGIDRGLLHGILDGQTCPTCGQKLPEGQYVETRR